MTEQRTRNERTVNAKSRERAREREKTMASPSASRASSATDVEDEDLGTAFVLARVKNHVFGNKRERDDERSLSRALGETDRGEDERETTSVVEVGRRRATPRVVETVLTLK